MSEWKTIPPNTIIRPNLATCRKADIIDFFIDYVCKGHLITEDNFIIDCNIGYALFYDDYDEERIFPRFYKELI